MKTIYIVVSGSRGSLWRFWISALSAAGYNIDIMDPVILESKAVEIQPGDAILFDGALPSLSPRVARIAALYPEARIIVASETDHSVVHCEVPRLDGATYVSGSISPALFVEEIQAIVSRAPAEAIPA